MGSTTSQTSTCTNISSTCTQTCSTCKTCSTSKSSGYIYASEEDGANTDFRQGDVIKIRRDQSGGLYAFYHFAVYIGALTPIEGSASKDGTVSRGGSPRGSSHQVIQLSAEVQPPYHGACRLTHSAAEAKREVEEPKGGNRLSSVGKMNMTTRIDGDDRVSGRTRHWAHKALGAQGSTPTGRGGLVEMFAGMGQSRNNTRTTQTTERLARQGQNALSHDLGGPVDKECQEGDEIIYLTKPEANEHCKCKDDVTFVEVNTESMCTSCNESYYTDIACRTRDESYTLANGLDKERKMEGITMKKELNSMLTGKTSERKSATGKTILSHRMFTDSSKTSETTDVVSKFTRFDNFLIKVTDCPGLMNTDMDSGEDKTSAALDMAMALNMCLGGVDAFICVIKLERFTDETTKLIDNLNKIFGDRYKKHVIVITGGDKFRDDMEKEGCGKISFTEWCNQERRAFKQLVNDFSDRFLLLNNREKSPQKNETQRQEIIQLADSLRKSNDRYLSDGVEEAKVAREKVIVQENLLMLNESLQMKDDLPSADLLKLMKAPSDREWEGIPQSLNDLRNHITEKDTGTSLLNHLTVNVDEVKTDLLDGDEIHFLAENLENSREENSREPPQGFAEADIQCHISCVCVVRAVTNFWMKQRCKVPEVKKALMISDYKVTVAHIVLVLVLVASVVGSSAVPTHICPKGTHLLKVQPGMEVCPLCQDGVTYMTDHWHTHLECFNCTRLIDPEVERLVTECNITHDTVIHCKSGFYRKLARNPHQSDQCVKCSECEEENPTRLCGGFYDTVCCGLPSYEAVLNKDNVYICKEKPIVCTQGQYYSSHYEQCFPCPPDTYMSEDPHNNKECKLCQTVGNNSSRLLLQACNSTHPAIVDCKPGYFRHSPQEYPLSDDDCSPCHTCQFVGRECTSDHDTVCCDRPQMTVIDNNTGLVCVPFSDTSDSSNTEGLTGEPRSSQHITVCGQNEFINIINDSLTCQRCREGTYNDVLNHNRTSCQDCSEFSGRQLPASCHTGNDVFKNTESGMSIHRIVCLVSPILSMLVIVAYFILKLWKCVRYHKQGRTKYMYLLEIKLLNVVTMHMVFSWILSVFVTNNIVGITVVSISTIILFPAACYLLYKFWKQIKSNKGNYGTDHASTNSIRAMERLNCVDTV